MNTKRRPQGRAKASEELRAAEGRVGAKVEDRARWLVTFSRRREEDSTRALEGETLGARWEALAFASGRSWTIAEDAEPPTWAEVTRASRHLQAGVVTPLRSQEPIVAEWVGELLPRPGGSFATRTYTADLPFLRAFMVQAFEVLRQLTPTGLRLRLCPVCKRPFLTKRADAKVCPTGSCRTLAWRRQNRDAFRATRRKAYERQMKKKIGPNVRIKTHSKKGS